jgi:hypothetical protein
MLKELKKHLDAGATQIAITLEEDEGDSSKNVYMLVVHGVKSEDQQSEQNS